MITLEEQYSLDIKVILAKFPKGTEERKAAKGELSEKFQVARFLRDCTVRGFDALYKIQNQFAIDIYNVIEAFYSGKFPAKDYLVETIAVFRQHCARLMELGVLKSIPNDEWFRPFASAFIKIQLKLLSTKTSDFGFSSEEAALLCNPCREYSRDFFSAIHSQFGVDQLKDNPEIYGGVITAIRAEEQER
jgi:hypothetical protein